MGLYTLLDSSPNSWKEAQIAFTPIGSKAPQMLVKRVSKVTLISSVDGKRRHEKDLI